MGARGSRRAGNRWGDMRLRGSAGASPSQGHPHSRLSQNTSLPGLFAQLSFCHADLFRVSDFEFRVSDFASRISLCCRRYSPIACCRRRTVSLASCSARSREISGSGQRKFSRNRPEKEVAVQAKSPSAPGDGSGITSKTLLCRPQWSMPNRIPWFLIPKVGRFTSRFAMTTRCFGRCPGCPIPAPLRCNRAPCVRT